jgi:hypothetical protein
MMLECHVVLLDGEKVLVRSLKPDDAALYPDFLSEVTADDLRLRFFVPMREVSHDLIDKLIHYDPDHAMAFIAISEASGRMLGVVRLHDDRTGEGGEFAILLRSHGTWIGLAPDEAHGRLCAGERAEKRARTGAGGKRDHAADVRRVRLSRRR